MNSLPADARAREAKLRYLRYLIELAKAGDNQAAVDYNAGFNLSNSASRLLDATQIDKVRAALAAEKVPESGTPVFIPDFLRRMTPAERLAVWDDLLVFNAQLPADSEKQEFILRWLSNYGYGSDRVYDWRLDLYKFLVGEKKDPDGHDLSLPADPQVRAELLHYMETWGGDPRLVAHRGQPVFSVWFHITDPFTMWVVHLTALFVMLLFTLGLWTRVTSALTWALTLSYIHRSQMILFGQDTMQTILVTYLMIGPSGATFSLDALRKRYRASRALLGGGKPVPWAESVLAGPRASWLANFAIRLLQINFCFIYMSSGLSKLKGSTWWEHSAPWLILVNQEFGLIRYRSVEWMVHGLSEFRPAVSLVAAGIAGFTLALEIGFPFLVWTRLRPFAIVCSVLMHLGIAVMMGLTVFGLYMFAMLLCYFPAKLIRDRIGHQPGSGPKMTVRYDSRDRAAVRKAALIRSLDVSNQVTFVDNAGKAPASSTVVLVDAEGRQTEGEALFQAATRSLVLVRPLRFLGYVPGVWALLNGWFGRK
jgi:hypothetical protein